MGEREEEKTEENGFIQNYAEIVFILSLSCHAIKHLTEGKLKESCSRHSFPILDFQQFQEFLSS